ncbi:MAG: hypothetical protein HC822_21585 [Oscillochloris sp.]|nr:hypothetical protein [Oscillochloris sp.]
MDYPALILAALLYPGLLTALVFGLIYHRLLYGRLPVPTAAGLSSREGMATFLSMLLAGGSLAALPWPYHPSAASDAWLWAWAGFELAFLLPLLPALLGARRSWCAVRSASCNLGCGRGCCCGLRWRWRSLPNGQLRCFRRTSWPWRRH